MNSNDKKSQPFGIRFLSTHANSVRTGVKAGLIPDPGHGVVSMDLMRLPGGGLSAAT